MERQVPSVHSGFLISGRRIPASPMDCFPVSFSRWQKSLLLEWMVCVSILENKTFGYFSHIPCYVVAFLSAVSKPQEFSFLTKAWDRALCMEGVKECRWLVALLLLGY